MQTVGFDTLQFVNTLVGAGFPREQAEGLVRAQTQIMYKVADEQAATKHDILRLEREIVEIRKEIDGLKRDVAEIKKEVAEIKKEVAEIKESVRKIELQIETVKADVFKWIVPLLMAQAGAFAAIIKFL